MCETLYIYIYSCPAVYTHVISFKFLPIQVKASFDLDIPELSSYYCQIQINKYKLMDPLIQYGVDWYCSLTGIKSLQNIVGDEIGETHG